MPCIQTEHKQLQKHRTQTEKLHQSGSSSVYVHVYTWQSSTFNVCGFGYVLYLAQLAVLYTKTQALSVGQGVAPLGCGGLAGCRRRAVAHRPPSCYYHLAAGLVLIQCTLTSIDHPETGTWYIQVYLCWLLPYVLPNLVYAFAADAIVFPVWHLWCGTCGTVLWSLWLIAGPQWLVWATVRGVYLRTQWSSLFFEDQTGALMFMLLLCLECPDSSGHKWLVFVCDCM